MSDVTGGKEGVMDDVRTAMGEADQAEYRTKPSPLDIQCSMAPGLVNDTETTWTMRCVSARSFDVISAWLSRHTHTR